MSSSKSLVGSKLGASNGVLQSTIGFPRLVALIPGLLTGHSVRASIAAREPPMSSPQMPSLGPCGL